jgi:hypothetical protein
LGDLPVGHIALNRLAKSLIRVTIRNGQIQPSASRGNTGYDSGFSSASFGFLALDFAGAFDA